MAVPSITWRLSNNDLSNDSINTITSEQGDMFIQNGGAQPIPSVTSTLTVNLTRDPLTTSTRVYNCISSSQMMNPLVQTIVLSECSILYPHVVVYWVRHLSDGTYFNVAHGKLILLVAKFRPPLAVTCTV